MSEDTYDTIVIGSGMGGLTVASLLAQLRRKRVLVLERHYKIGGFTHTFQRKGRFHWGIGVHYVGEMGEGCRARELMDFITRRGVKWNKMTDPYDVFVYPDFTFELHAGEARLEADLASRFPQERAAIRRYLRDMRRAFRWSLLQNIIRTLPGVLPTLFWPVGLVGRRLALTTTREYLDRRFRDERLKALVASQWGNYGLPPSMSALVVHAVITTHYRDGGYYPENTSRTIADSIAPIVKEAGGDLLTSHEVTEIIVDGDRATGVRAIARRGGGTTGEGSGGDTSARKEGAERIFRADQIVSDIGAATTYLKLLPERYGDGVRADTERLGDGFSNVTLYAGLKTSPETLGFRGENHWITRSLDHDDMYRRRDEILEARPGVVYLSFPSLKDPLATAHTCEMIAPVSYAAFRRWRDLPWKKRGPEYEDLKRRISEAMISFVDTRYPGFRDLIEYHELSTPITTEHFTAHPGGSIYGLPAVPDRYRLSWRRVVTPLKNVFLTGADVTQHGIVGSMYGGVVTVSRMLGAWGFLRISLAARAFGKKR